jgi:hypothetical protein
MTWMTWRQHRGAASVGAAVLAAIAAALVWLGITARSKVRHFGLTSCMHNGTDCTTAIAHLQRQYHWLPPVAASLFALPLLAGMFWGAPLIAREIETGTYRLVWTQSISRLRWISTKLALVMGVTATATLALSLLAVWAFQPLIPVLGNRFRGGWFDVEGIIPAAYMLFAMALGICMGAVWRKTIPAMATTIVGYAAVRIPVHNLRRHLLSLNVKTVSDTTFIGPRIVKGAAAGSALAKAAAALHQVGPGGVVAAQPAPWPSGLGPGDWILSQSPTGAPTSGPPTKGPPASIYHYIPAGRFWTLQGIEAAIFIVLTAALIAVCLTVVVRSRPH